MKTLYLQLALILCAGAALVVAASVLLVQPANDAAAPVFYAACTAALGA